MKYLCPVFQLSNFDCRYYSYQEDRNGEVDICFCGNPKNPDKYEGNCQKRFCPIWQEFTKGNET